MEYGSESDLRKSKNIDILNQVKEYQREILDTIAYGTNGGRLKCLASFGRCAQT